MNRSHDFELFWGENPQAEVDDVAGERDEKRLKKEWILDKPPLTHLHEALELPLHLTRTTSTIHKQTPIYK